MTFKTVILGEGIKGLGFMGMGGGLHTNLQNWIYQIKVITRNFIPNFRLTPENYGKPYSIENVHVGQFQLEYHLKLTSTITSTIIFTHMINASTIDPYKFGY